MSGWQGVEVYGTFMKVTGEIEVLGIDRLSDSVNRYGSFLSLRNCRSEPLSVNYPVLSRAEPAITIAKSGVLLLCPLDEDAQKNSVMWQEVVPFAASINTSAFSVVCDVHLAPGHDLRDHLERHPGDFLPVTNLSALWITTLTTETQALQRPFGLLNPASILSFALHPPR